MLLLPPPPLGVSVLRVQGRRGAICVVFFSQDRIDKRFGKFWNQQQVSAGQVFRTPTPSTQVKWFTNPESAGGNQSRARAGNIYSLCGCFFFLYELFLVFGKTNLFACL